MNTKNISSMFFVGFLSQVRETFYTSIETTCIDRETIL